MPSSEQRASLDPVSLDPVSLNRVSLNRVSLNIVVISIKSRLCFATASLTPLAAC